MTGREFDSEASLDAFLRAFEDGSYPGKEWTHAAHVAMAAAYLSDLPIEEAAGRIRAAIPAYNVAQGGQNTDTSGYHETLTVFWIRILARFLESLPAEAERIDRVRRAVAEFGEARKLHQAYWSFDVAKSVEARHGWVAPDLQSL